MHTLRITEPVNHEIPEFEALCRKAHCASPFSLSAFDSAPAHIRVASRRDRTRGHRSSVRQLKFGFLQRKHVYLWEVLFAPNPLLCTKIEASGESETAAIAHGH